MLQLHKLPQKSPLTTNMKPNSVKNIFLRLLIFFIFLFLLRFIFIISFNGDFCNLSSSTNFCFFSNTPSSSQQHSTQITILPNFRASNEYEFYCKIFQDFIIHGFLSPNSSAFCLNSSHIIALKDLGIVQSFSLSSEIVSSHLPFSDQFFDFMFFHKFDLPSSIPLLGFVLEIERKLKPSGILVIHTQIKDFYAFHSILKLFDFCSFVKGRDIPGPNPSIPSIREIILKKPIIPIHKIDRKDSIEQCSVSGYSIQLINNSEPLIEKEPLKPWITLKRNLKNVKYLTSMVDISFKPRYAYIDVGSRSYGSSIGSWFNKRYQKQNKTFEVFAIEADKSFHGELQAKKGVTLLPYAAWVRNETLFFEINREPTKKMIEANRGMGRIQPVQSSINFEGSVDQIRGFDFAEWLKGEFEERDFVVVKMDVEGTEFQLIPRLIETGALCLIDEIFLECHYNRWQKCCPGVRSPKYDKTYDQCLNLLSFLRDRGVLVHQWW